MGKYLFIILVSLLTFLLRGQQLGQETWTKITYEVKQLVLVNEKIQCELDSLLFPTTQDTLEDVLTRYKYFHLYVTGDKNNQKLEFRLSNYPYKSKTLIGFFTLRGYPIFVYNELPEFLKMTKCNKKFTYTEHKLGDLIIMEDDTPCWIIEYKNCQFKVLHYPTKLYEYLFN